MYYYNDLMLDFSELYESVNKRPFRDVHLPFAFKAFGDILEQNFNAGDKPFIKYKVVSPVSYKGECEKVTVCFSGGKDSAALAFKLRDQGKTVVLLHYTGINKAYPDERHKAQAFAEKYGFPMLVRQTPFIVQKGDYVENIVKNFALLAASLSCGETFGVYSTGLGCAVTTDELLSDYGFSDSQTPLKAFASGVNELFGSHVYISELEKEYDSYRCLVEHSVDFGDIVSCMMPLRYRGRLNQTNTGKGFVVRPSGCGSCYKCAMDYFSLVSLGVLQPTRESDQHYIDVFWKDWSHSIKVKPQTVEALLHAFVDESIISNILERLK